MQKHSITYLSILFLLAISPCFVSISNLEQNIQISSTPNSQALTTARSFTASELIYAITYFTEYNTTMDFWRFSNFTNTTAWSKDVNNVESYNLTTKSWKPGPFGDLPLQIAYAQTGTPNKDSNSFYSQNYTGIGADWQDYGGGYKPYFDLVNLFYFFTDTGADLADFFFNVWTLNASGTDWALFNQSTALWYLRFNRTTGYLIEQHWKSPGRQFRMVLVEDSIDAYLSRQVDGNIWAYGVGDSFYIKIGANSDYYKYTITEISSGPVSMRFPKALQNAQNQRYDLLTEIWAERVFANCSKYDATQKVWVQSSDHLGRSSPMIVGMATAPNGGLPFIIGDKIYPMLLTPNGFTYPSNETLYYIFFSNYTYSVSGNNASITYQINGVNCYLNMELGANGTLSTTGKFPNIDGSQFTETIATSITTSQLPEINTSPTQTTGGSTSTSSSTTLTNFLPNSPAGDDVGIYFVTFGVALVGLIVILVVSKKSKMQIANSQ
jgi:hypothetical protein